MSEAFDNTADSASIDTGTDHLMASLRKGVLTITLNRPKARNALTPELLRAFGEQLLSAEQNLSLIHI